MLRLKYHFSCTETEHKFKINHVTYLTQILKENCYYNSNLILNHVDVITANKINANWILTCKICFNILLFSMSYQDTNSTLRFKLSPDFTMILLCYQLNCLSWQNQVGCNFAANIKQLPLFLNQTLNGMVPIRICVPDNICSTYT